MRKVFPLPPEVFGDHSPSHSFRQESALAGPFPYAQFASVCPRFSASRCSTRPRFSDLLCLSSDLLCLYAFHIPRPRFSDLLCLSSDLLCLYSSVCDGYIPRPRFSDLLCLFSDLLCLYSSVCDGCTSSTLFRLTVFVFRLTMFVLVCL